MPEEALRLAIAELNRAKTALQQALDRGADADAESRARARVAAAEERVKDAQARVRRAAE